jgi:two-component system chemotaxis response regulator CheY
MSDNFDPSTRILVVDDMSSLRALSIGFLVDMGFFDIVEAGDGNEAWEKIESSDPPIQLILCDLNMPNLNGIELLKKVRADAKHGNLPFIMITTESETQLVLQAAQLRVTNYVVKPLTPTTLKVKLQQTFKRHTGQK